MLPLAQQIGGTIGFITNMVRPDCHFAYCVLARYINAPRLERTSAT